MSAPLIVLRRPEHLGVLIDDSFERGQVAHVDGVRRSAARRALSAPRVDAPSTLGRRLIEKLVPAGVTFLASDDSASVVSRHRYGENLRDRPPIEAGDERRQRPSRPLAFQPMLGEQRAHPGIIMF